MPTSSLSGRKNTGTLCLVSEIDSFEEFCRNSGVSVQVIDHHPGQYGKIGTADLRRLTCLEEENRHLRRLVADLSLTKSLLQEVVWTK